LQALSAMPARGFTLIEVLIATGLLVVVAAGTAGMFALALRQNMAARDQLLMTSSAARKVDSLAASASGGTLAASPPDALDRDYDGFSDVDVSSGVPIARRWLLSFPPLFAGAAAAIVVRAQRSSGGPRVEIATVGEVGAR
jgi:prepilin-type N-terminal cleavage/methylation domain-containing protein